MDINAMKLVSMLSLLFFGFSLLANAFTPEEIETWQIAAEKGDAEAQCNLASALMHGRGIYKDNKESQKWFIKSAEQGYAEAQFMLGFWSIAGAFGDGEVDKGTSLIKAAAEQGHTGALHYLGVFQYTMERSNEETPRWIMMAAEKGDLEAMVHIAHIYYHGDLLQKDLAKAFKWYRKAAEQGNITAQVKLGACYWYGLEQVVAPNFQEAFKWFKAAAEKGNTEAQSILGRAYFLGHEGVPQDFVLAYKWFNLAAAGGDEASEEMIHMLASTSMTREQVAEGQRLSREWTATEAKSK